MKQDLKIGDIVYPKDSYQFCLSGDSDVLLAGTEDTPAKGVKIISNMYIGLASVEGFVSAFRDVEYEDKIYRVYNWFHDSEESMLKHKNIK